MANKVEQNNMKDSGYSWIREVPSDWNIGRIKELFYLSKEKINGNAQDYQIFSLTMKGLKKRDVTTNEGQIAVSYDKYARLRKDDIVLNPMDLNSGFVARQSLDGIISPAYSIMRPRTTNINSKFFERYFQYHYFYNIFFPFGKGISYDYRWTLGDSTLINFPIVVPPKKTQEKIVSYLDAKIGNIDSLIKKKEKMIELLSSEIRSISMNEQINGKGIFERIQNLVKVTKRPAYPAKENEFEPLGLYNRGRGIFHKKKEFGGNMGDSKFFFVEEGDLILSGQFAWEGAVALTGARENKCVVSHRYPVLRGTKISTEYLFALLISNFGDFILNESSRGAAGRNRPLNLNRFLKEKIRVPSRESEEVICHKLLHKRKLEEKIKQQIKLLKEYKSSLIYHTVTGKLKI